MTQGWRGMLTCEKSADSGEGRARVFEEGGVKKGSRSVICA